jgi:DNA-binding transcriptional ArsR family regulator
MSAESRQIVFQALADPTRRELLDRLRTANGQSLAALARGLGMSRQAVTKHLDVLEEAGLVLAARRGRQRLHYLNPVPIQAVALRWLAEFGAVALGALAEVRT